MASERDPSLAEIVRRLVEARLVNLWLPYPARVVAYDADKQRADCQPLVKLARTLETGERQADSLPVVPSVPVLTLGGGGAALTFPIKAGASDGDTGLLVFLGCSVDRWLSGQGGEVDPEIDHLSALHDAVILVGLRPFGAPLPGVPTDHTTLGTAGPDDGTHLKLHLRSNLITAGPEQGAQLVALANLVASTLDRLQAVLDVLFSPTSAPINEPGNGAPSALQLALIAALGPAGARITGPGATWPDSVAAQYLKTS